ncbi:MAG: polysaccharide deacetylase family protein [Imperialibacter sp.]|uniref:polysaccharide deacetylase family protein n=1 Tax=Imperialibacter sp. TaxID=2038411 RepID=UPI0032EBE0A4
MISKKILIFLCLLAAIVACQPPNTAEKLGYPADTKLLIIHADDLGVAHSENAASIEAFEKSGISSASIMVPCPWFPEIAKYGKEHPDKDLGLHLTLTAEWENYKWDGVSMPSQIPSLIGADGFFYPTSEEVAQNAKPEEVEKEIRAQVQMAIDAGLKPSHLDSHMGSLFQTSDLFKIYQKVGREFGIPVMIPAGLLEAAPPLFEAIDEVFVPVNRLYMMGEGVAADQWGSTYTGWMKELQPGLNVLLVHLAYDDDEMQAVTVNHPDFGAAWRQRDLDYVLSDEFKEVLKSEGIQPVTWRQIQEITFNQK